MADTDTDTNPVVVSKWSWQQFSNRINVWWMEKMGIPLQTRFEALFLANDIGGEVGELKNKIKKYVRDGMTPELYEAIGKEMADVRILLYHLEKYFNFDLDQECASKVEELFQRWPEIEKLPISREWPYKVGTGFDDYPAYIVRGIR